MKNYTLPKLNLVFYIIVWVSNSVPLFSQEISPRKFYDIERPSARVTGDPGGMSYIKQDCDPKEVDGLRERIVHTAIQEWVYFGFQISDLTHTRDDNPDYVRQPWTRPVIERDAASRVAATIAGYWSSTPNSQWILERQNQYWNERGAGSRWRNPWSAAFISWVICESGIDDPKRFKRAVAHHVYIDQAIGNREKGDSKGLYFAYDIGEEFIEPGDLLCRSSRPHYETLAARKAQLGVGARTHCDFVVKLDEEKKRIMVIGGNVRAWVRLKLLPADYSQDGAIIPAPYDGRRIFAHLKLRAKNVSEMVFDESLSIWQQICGENSADLEEIISVDAGLCID